MNQKNGSFVSVKLLAAVILWVGLGFFYVFHIPKDFRDWDFDGHVQYTQIITQQRRLPSPYEGWETWQPPLYYLVNSLIHPVVADPILSVRLYSVLYGALVILLMAWLSYRLSISLWIQIPVLFFIFTTPTFFYIFAAYNNDSLSILFSVALIIFWYELLRKWNWGVAAMALCFGAAGLYTKYTVGLTIVVIFVLTVFLAFRKAVPYKKAGLIIGMLLTAYFLLVPWLLFHNYASTKTFFPSNFSSISSELQLSKPPLQVALTPPGFNNGEWSDPFVHGWEPAISKRNSYFAYLFSSSIFGEWSFKQSPGLSWSLIWLHLFICGWAVKMAWKSGLGRLVLAFIGLAILMQITFVVKCVPFSCDMEFRYIAWTWLAWTVLCGLGLQRAWDFKKRRQLAAVLALLWIGGGIHLYCLFAEIGIW